jgi:ACS family tartrate transporter-like MFS transporter
VQGAAGFFIVRFLLGACEAGFFPGVILYLTYWFPAASRGRFNGLFLSAIMISNIIGSPVSGWILHSLGGVGGFKGWQWLFFIEALPSFVLAFVTLAVLPSKPSDASWLSAAEKQTIATALGQDDIQHASLHEGLRDPRIWLLSLADFGIVLGVYGIGLWLPQIVAALGFGTLQTGFIVAVPYLVTIVAMIGWARISDRRGERVWHIIQPALLAAASLLAASLLGASIWTVVVLTVATAAIYAALAVLWTLPPAFRGGTAAAGAIALVNAIANLGGFLGPIIVGYLKQSTGGYSAPMAVLALGLLMTALIIFMMARALPVPKPMAVLK